MLLMLACLAWCGLMMIGQSIESTSDILRAARLREAIRQQNAEDEPWTREAGSPER
jgi:hypothetical protein